MYLLIDFLWPLSADVALNKGFNTDWAFFFFWHAHPPLKLPDRTDAWAHRVSGCIHVGLEFDEAHCTVSTYAAMLQADVAAAEAFYVLDTFSIESSVGKSVKIWEMSVYN